MATRQEILPTAPAIDAPPSTSYRDQKLMSQKCWIRDIHSIYNRCSEVDTWTRRTQLFSFFNSPKVGGTVKSLSVKSSGQGIHAIPVDLSLPNIARTDLIRA